MLYLYSLGIYVYGAILRLVALLDPKAKLLVMGREQTLNIVRSKKAEFPNAKWIWIHAASLGEFEQGRHLIDRLSTEHSDCRIALSFYSPSGYEPRNNYKNADMVFYMPLDTLRNAKALIDALEPKLAIFIKYDFWWNHLNVLQSKAIPTVFVSAMIRQDQYFIRYKLGKIRSILSEIDHFYVQTKGSADILKEIDIAQVTITGDGRLDSILSEEVHNLAIQQEIVDWKLDQKCIIYGSVHVSDLDVIKAMSSIDAKHIVVPHDIDKANLKTIKSHLEDAQLYSDTGFHNSLTVILDQLGVLRHLYGTADLVYVGGGFGSGIHNTLEPLVHLVPILIGPNYGKFPEAVDLIEKDAIKTIDTANLAYKVAIEMLEEPDSKRKSTQSQYIRGRSGATDMVVTAILNNKWI